MLKKKIIIFFCIFFCIFLLTGCSNTESTESTEIVSDTEETNVEQNMFEYYTMLFIESQNDVTTLDNYDTQMLDALNQYSAGQMSLEDLIDNFRESNTEGVLPLQNYINALKESLETDGNDYPDLDEYHTALLAYYNQVNNYAETMHNFYDTVINNQGNYTQENLDEVQLLKNDIPNYKEAVMQAFNKYAEAHGYNPQDLYTQLQQDLQQAIEDNS